MIPLRNKRVFPFSLPIYNIGVYKFMSIGIGTSNQPSTSSFSTSGNVGIGTSINQPSTSGTSGTSGIYGTRRRVTNSLSTLLGNITRTLLVKLQSRVCDK